MKRKTIKKGPRSPRPRVPLHWMVRDLFDDATERGLHSPGWEPFSKLIEEKTALKIPTGTLKYWKLGFSTPKINEVEAMALALDYELDLLLVKPSN
jgi:hypothetical protein